MVKIITPELPIDKIIIGKRFREDLGDIKSLAESINRVGLINPITARQIDEGYKLLAGYRRLMAVKMLGWTRIPATIIPKVDGVSLGSALTDLDFDKACEICDYPITDKHHIIPKDYGGTDEEENIIYLCPNHHRAIHFLMNIDMILDDERKRKRLDDDESRGHKFLQRLRQIYDFDPKVKIYYHEFIIPKLPHFLTEEETWGLAKARVLAKKKV